MRRALPLLALGACLESEQALDRGPRAFAGFDRAVPTGEPALLDGSGSADGDGDRLVYRWSLVAKPAGAGAAVEDPDHPVARLRPDLPGGYVLALRVDDQRRSDGDLLTLEAVDAPAPPMTDELRLDPPSCAVLLARAGAGGCEREGRVELRALLSSGSTAALAADFTRLPPGAAASEQGLELLPERLTFRPSRPGRYLLAVRAAGRRRSNPALFSLEVFAPPVQEVPVARLAARGRARVGERLLLDSRASRLPAGRAERSWSIALSPPGAADRLLDVATGCGQDECRIFFPSAPGLYWLVVELQVDGVLGVPAHHLLEVEP